MSYHRLIPIHIDEAVRWYHSGMPELEKLALRAYTAEEIETTVSETAEIAFLKLRRLRDEDRCGWKPDWTDGTMKYCITCEGRSIIISKLRASSQFLSFDTEERAKAFLDKNIHLIMQAKDLI